MGRSSVVIVITVSLLVKYQEPLYKPNVPEPSLLNFASPTNFSRGCPAPLASSPLTSKLSLIQILSVRKLNLSLLSSFLLQEKNTIPIAISARNNVDFLMS